MLATEDRDRATADHGEAAPLHTLEETAYHGAQARVGARGQDPGIGVRVGEIIATGVIADQAAVDPGVTTVEWRSQVSRTRPVEIGQITGEGLGLQTLAALHGH